VENGSNLYITYKILYLGHEDFMPHLGLFVLIKVPSMVDIMVDNYLDFSATSFSISPSTAS
jgi:hypothetical protein